MTKLTVQTATSVEQLRDHRAPWLALWTALPDANPFYHPDMLLPAWQHLDAEQVVVYLVFRDAELVALVPVQQRNRFRGAPARWLRAWGYIHCFSDAPLIQPALAKQVSAQLATCWREQGAIMASWLKLPALATWPPALGDDPLPQRRACLQPAAADFQPIDQSLSKKKLKEYRRQWRRLEEAGELRFDIVTGTAVADHLDNFIALEAAGWKGENNSALGSTGADEQFLRTFVAALSAQGLTRLYQLTLADKPVAMLLGLANATELYLFKICFDESLSRFSPGVLLMLEATRVWEQGEFALVDSCAQQDHPMIDKLWPQKRLITRHHLATGGLYSRLLLTLSRWMTRWQTRKEHTHEHMD